MAHRNPIIHTAKDQPKEDNKAEPISYGNFCNKIEVIEELNRLKVGNKAYDDGLQTAILELEEATTDIFIKIEKALMDAAEEEYYHGIPRQADGIQMALGIYRELVGMPNE